MKEEWLMPSAVVPVDSKTTAALVNEVKRLIGVVGSMALAAAERDQARELLEELNMSIESKMASQIVSYIQETAQHRKVDMPILLALLNARLLQAPEPELHVDGVEMGKQLQAEMTKGVITKCY